MSEQLLKSSCDLYLKHEIMLDEEKDKRADLATLFQGKMGSLQTEINGEKVERKEAYDKNEGIRNKIQAAIDDYKNKETDYQTKMGVHNIKIQEI